MTELVFILTDFFALTAGPRAAAIDRDAVNARRAQGRGAVDARHSDAALPRLPALETLLARAHSEALPDDWRAWLAARAGVTAPMTPAATVAAARAQAHEVAARTHYWLATPVHLVAGLDGVQLHPEGLLRLTEAEQQALVEQFADVFADSPWSLTALGQRELLLAGPPLYASGIDPARFAGADPSPGLPRGQDAAALKRLGSEIELWLHEQPINLERNRRGEPAITTLWLWGGPIASAAGGAAGVVGTPAGLTGPTAAGMSAVEPRRPLAHLFGRDIYAEALWQLRSAAAEPLPAGLDAAARLLDGPADSVLLYPTMRHDAGVTGAFVQLEQRWLAAASDALRRRRIGALQLLAGARAYRLSWLDFGRLWRPRAPWWEVLA